MICTPYSKMVAHLNLLLSNSDPKKTRASRRRWGAERASRARRLGERRGLGGARGRTRSRRGSSRPRRRRLGGARGRSSRPWSPGAAVPWVSSSAPVREGAARLRADLGERRAWRRRHTWSSRGRRAWRRRRSWVSGSGGGLASGFGCSVSHGREGREAALGGSLSPSGQLPRRPRRWPPRGASRGRRASPSSFATVLRHGE